MNPQDLGRALDAELSELTMVGSPADDLARGQAAVRARRTTWGAGVVAASVALGWFGAVFLAESFQRTGVPSSVARDPNPTAAHQEAWLPGWTLGAEVERAIVPADDLRLCGVPRADEWVGTRQDLNYGSTEASVWQLEVGSELGGIGIMKRFYAECLGEHGEVNADLGLANIWRPSADTAGAVVVTGDLTWIVVMEGEELAEAELDDVILLGNANASKAGRALVCSSQSGWAPPFGGEVAVGDASPLAVAERLAASRVVAKMLPQGVTSSDLVLSVWEQSDSFVDVALPTGQKLGHIEAIPNPSGTGYVMGGMSLCSY